LLSPWGEIRKNGFEIIFQVGPVQENDRNFVFPNLHTKQKKDGENRHGINRKNCSARPMCGFILLIPLFVESRGWRAWRARGRHGKANEKGNTLLFALASPHWSIFV
jgi:hypothetical protein